VPEPVVVAAAVKVLPTDVVPVKEAAEIVGASYKTELEVAETDLFPPLFEYVITNLSIAP
jgi:hypothetical protein